MKTQKVTVTVNVGGIIREQPPLLLWWTRARRPDGKERVISQAVRVLDEQLLQQLEAVTTSGDTIEVCMVTEWGDGTPPSSYLAGFAKDGQRYGQFDTTQEAA